MDTNSLINFEASNLNKELTLIEYPAVVKNDERMLNTLGGIQRISESFCNPKKRLELRFHTKNLYNKPANGTSHTIAGILFKVKVKKIKNQDENASGINEVERVVQSIEILGKCKKLIRFDSLFDYQYLPINYDKEANKAEYIYHKIIPNGIMDQEYFKRDKIQLHCVPQSFSRTEVVHYKLHKAQEKTEKNCEHLGAVRMKSDSSEMQTFNLTDPFPSKPNPLVVKRLMIKYVSDVQLEKVKKLFDECPIWNRITLLYECQVGNDKLKCILPSLAYYFVSGPWRNMFCRFGYDPRKDFQSRFYQTFDYRMRYKTGIAEYVKVRKIANKEPSTSKGGNLVQDVHYPYFEEGQLPRARQCMFRYCDIRIPKIQEMLKKTPTPLTGATCNEKTGWLPHGFDDQCRQIVANSLKEHMISIHQEEKEREALESSDEDDQEESVMEDIEDVEQVKLQKTNQDTSIEEQTLLDEVLMDIDETI